MSAEYFTEAAVSFIACVTVFTIFLNFLLLAAEELKKCSIIKRKKKNYAVVRPSGRMVLQGPDRVCLLYTSSESSIRRLCLSPI